MSRVTWNYLYSPNIQSLIFLGSHGSLSYLGISGSPGSRGSPGSLSSQSYLGIFGSPGSLNKFGSPSFATKLFEISWFYSLLGFLLIWCIMTAFDNMLSGFTGSLYVRIFKFSKLPISAGFPIPISTPHFPCLTLPFFPTRL